MQPEKLPYELEEEILSLVPPKSLTRFKSVCKRWNVLLNDKRFVNKHLARARPQFIFISDSRICAVDVNLDGPSIKVHDLPSYIPGYEYSMPRTIGYCDGLLVFATESKSGIGICNPWLGQIRWIKSEVLRSFRFSGMGYDYTRPELHYKIFASNESNNNTTMEANITELDSNVRQSYAFATGDWNIDESKYSISLNGTLYWIALNSSSLEHFIQSFDFSVERFKPFCILPTKFEFGPYKVRSLAVFKGDRISYLEHNSRTKKIKIWVTKNKIKNGDGEGVEWMKLMKVAIPKLSNLGYLFYDRPSYFIDDKSLILVLCYSNSKGKVSIYIAKGDKFYEFRIQELVDNSYPRHCTYFPSLTPLSMGENNEGTFTMSGMGRSTQQLRSPFTLPRGVETTNGVGENEWDDGFFNNVKKIRLGQKNDVVVFVKFDYSNDNTVVAGAAHGNSNQISITFNDFPIADDDYLKAVEGTYIYGHITSLTFRLRKRVTHQYGLKHGTSFVLRGGKGSKIIGFYGRRSDDYLTALGVHLFQRSSLPPST